MVPTVANTTHTVGKATPRQEDKGEGTMQVIMAAVMHHQEVMGIPDMANKGLSEVVATKGLMEVTVVIKVVIKATTGAEANKAMVERIMVSTGVEAKVMVVPRAVMPPMAVQIRMARLLELGRWTMITSITRGPSLHQQPTRREEAGCE